LVNFWWWSDSGFGFRMMGSLFHFRCGIGGHHCGIGDFISISHTVAAADFHDTWRNDWCQQILVAIRQTSESESGLIRNSIPDHSWRRFARCEYSLVVSRCWRNVAWCLWRCSLRRNADRVEQGWSAVLARQVRRQQLRQQRRLRVADSRRGRRISSQISLPHVWDREREGLRVKPARVTLLK